MRYGACTTISVYENLSKNDADAWRKNFALHLALSRSKERLPFCECKGTTFLQYDKERAKKCEGK